MSKKLFVGSLPYSTTEEELKEHFAGAGEIESAIIIIDKITGRSKGFGFVEYVTEDEAKKAIEMFNDKEFGGRALIVNEARPMRERPQENL